MVPTIVELFESASKPCSNGGGGGHKIGSHRGGGPFHLSSTSHVKYVRPTLTKPSLQVYSTPLKYERVAFTNLYCPFVMEAGDPHSKSGDRQIRCKGQEETTEL